MMLLGTVQRFENILNCAQKADGHLGRIDMLQLESGNYGHPSLHCFAPTNLWISPKGRPQVLRAIPGYR